MDYKSHHVADAHLKRLCVMGPVYLMYIIDEAEEKGSVRLGTISYQKASLNLPHHD